MYPDSTYRAFLLKMVDADSEAAIEEGILDRSVDVTHLRLIEDELIDDSVFGRLSEEEAKHFAPDFLSTHERKKRLRFATQMQRYSARYFSPAQRVGSGNVRKRLAVARWGLLLAGALACAVLAAGWLAKRNIMLRRELARASQESENRQRAIALLREQLYGQNASEASASHLTKAGTGAGSDEHSVNISGAASALSDALARLSAVQLSGGVDREVAAVPVLQIGPDEKMVGLTLNLPFAPHGTIREELLDSSGTVIWRQQFSAYELGAPTSTGIVILPASLFKNFDYRLRVQGGGTNERVTYEFRVNRE